MAANTVRVCHLTTVHDPTDSRIFVKECSSLVWKGYETHLVVLGARNDRVNGVAIHGVERPKSGRLMRALVGGWRVYRRALEIDADIYHIHDPELLPFALLLRRRRKDVIYDVHENYPQVILIRRWISERYRKWVSRAFRIFEDYVAKRMSYVIAATIPIRERFAKLQNVAVVANYPLIDELYRPGANAWPQKERAVAFVGSIERERGIYEVVEAVGKAGVPLYLAGHFHSPVVREDVGKLPGWEMVRELGYLDREGVAQVLAKSMAGLVIFHPTPNYVESLPIKLFEYMAAEIPVIVADFPVWRRIVEENECGVCVDPLDADAIAKAIRWFVDHPDEARRMGENGRKAVMNHYSWEEQFATLSRVYAQVAEDATSRRCRATRATGYDTT